MHVQSFDEAYFTALYGDAGRQTWADRARDRLIDRLVTSHHTPHDRPPLLDVGCGYGFLVERFRNRYTLYSTDISEHALAVARQRLPEVTFACGSAEEGGPLFPITFQVALLINVLEHLPAVRRTGHQAVPVAGLRAAGGILRPAQTGLAVAGAQAFPAVPGGLPPALISIGDSLGRPRGAARPA
jgi:SAM-dependent methyltransferase